MAQLDGAGVPRSLADACGLLFAAESLGLNETADAITAECSILSLGNAAWLPRSSAAMRRANDRDGLRASPRVEAPRYRRILV